MEKEVDDILGTEHIGIHEDAAQACAIANDAAAARADRKGTCYKPATVENCTFENGKYTAQAVSANHKGSCAQAVREYGWRWSREF